MNRIYLIFAVLFTTFLNLSCDSNSSAPKTQNNSNVLNNSTVSTCTPITGDTTDIQTPVLRITMSASWDENWFASPAVADIDNDGINEIIAARHSVLYVWNLDGTIKWRAAWNHNASDPEDHGGSRMWASPVIGDFNGDGFLEIAVGSDADSSSNVNVAVYNHLGELMNGWPQHFGGSHEVRSITAGDLDQDGIFEIVVNKTSEGPTTAVYNLDGTMKTGWPQVSESCNPEEPAEACWDYGGYNQNIGIADMDGDGYPDVISSYDAIGFGIFNRDGSPFLTHESFSDRVVTATEAYHDLALAQQGWGSGDRSEFTYSPPVMADLDQNGDMEVILVGDHEHSSSTANQGVTFWVLNPDMTRPTGWVTPKDSGANIYLNATLGQNIVSTRPNPSVGDFIQNSGLEILSPAYDGKLYAFSSDGTMLWSYRFGRTNPYVCASEALVADMNGDGVPEIIFTTYTSGDPREPDTPAHLIILNNIGEEVVRVEIFGRGSMAAPTIDDVDDDGDLEIIISLKDTLGGGLGGVQIWDVPGSHTNCMQWTTGRGNYLRNGNYGN
jgi:FG-GAP-like repeat